ncbi:flagellin [Thermanaeromonas toyohensis]|uniref:flagellin N-terminal helical domain-containing protein n=1 Tax=Thermanaeromonas toyohensis TaxID=161154 RepID=UPI0009FC3D3E
MRINTNIEAINAHRNLYQTSVQLQKAMERLSSGLRINRAADDAAGLAISERMRAQASGLDQAVRNCNDGIALVQTAEGALNEVNAMLNRMRDLAVQASNSTLTDNDRLDLQYELNQLLQEIDRIANTTEYNTMVLLAGSYATVPITIQAGSDKGQQVATTIGAVTTGAMGLSNLSITSISLANLAIGTIDAAIDYVTRIRAWLGAFQNRLEHTIANLQVAYENIKASESRIRDADIAMETVNYTRLQILQQAGTAVLAQANLAPQAVLQLLR